MAISVVAANAAYQAAARVASGKDFDAQGVLTGKNVRLLSESDAASLLDALNRHLPWTVTSVEAKPGVERPAAPFTTSTLTQEASRKLGFSTQRTMQSAQRLFQDGHISYHRTDSTTLSDEALAESARAIRELFGDDYYAAPRRYTERHAILTAFIRLDIQPRVRPRVSLHPVGEGGRPVVQRRTDDRVGSGGVRRRLGAGAVPRVGHLGVHER